ncbi:MAG: DUF2341 domain-containing protein [Candidatus Omnitrophica bacterium]|nr:DUF2341 domain-containing protein [Candidatus Omnitrophota bacterium]
MQNSIVVAESEEYMNKYAMVLILGALTVRPLQMYAAEVAGPAICESEPIKTSGTITAIGAYYEFEGEVILEVSANGGSSYTKIINGSILKQGFIPGNQLRYRANIPKGSILKNLVIGYEDTSGASTLYKNSELANYKHNKGLYVSGAEKELFNYPVKIELGSQLSIIGYSNLANTEHRTPNAELDYSDIYFTAADGQTPLYYCVEDGLAYVKLPQIPKEGSVIYIYYNESSVSGSRLAVLGSDENRKPKTEHRNPAKVFLFYDDFNGEKLDDSKWLVRKGLKEDYELKDGYLRLRDTAIISRNFKLKDAILEFKAKAQKDASIQAIVRGESTSLFLFSLEQLVYSSEYPGAEHTIAINDIAKLNIGKPIKADTDYIYKVIANPQGIIFERYSSSYEKQAAIQFMDAGGLEKGYIGLKAGASPYDEAASAYFDWIRVRPYCEIEPVVRGD